MKYCTYYTWLMTELAEQFGLERCVECSSCTDSCPSARNGGILPDKVVQLIIIRANVADIWKCLQCHRCTMVCPQGIDVSGMIRFLRNESSLRGEAPERFIRTYSQVSEHGRAIQMASRIEAQRKDLGLITEPMSEQTLAEIKGLFKEGTSDE